MKENTAKREYFLDIARGIAIFLVVVGHTSKPLSMSNNLAFSVHIPLFFVISGFLVNPEKYTIWEYIKKRALRLLAPYFLMTLVLACMEGTRFWTYIGSALYCSGKISAIVPELPDQPWFLPCLFVAETVYFCIRKMERFSWWKWVEYPVFIIVSVGGFFLSFVQYLPWSIDIALFVQFYFVIGMLLRKIRLFDRKKLLWVIGLGVILGAIWLFAVYYASREGNPHNLIISLNERQMDIPSILISLAGCLAVLCGSMVLGLIPIVRQPFAYLGKISVVIYLFHLTGVDPVSLGITNWMLNTLIRLAYSCIVAEVLRLVPGIRRIFGVEPWFYWNPIIYRFKKRYAHMKYRSRMKNRKR